MFRIVKAHKRHFSDLEWLKTYWLFSFSDYYDPNNVQFGALRVFNDVVVQPGAGFPSHPHREMEIVSIVLSGELTHEDGMGNRGVIRAGEVQRMSAGTGVVHSESNRGDQPVHFYQIWFLPRTPGLEPSYDQKSFAGVSRQNRLLPVASGQGLPDAVTFETPATLYLSDLEAGHSLDFHTREGRGVFVYVTEGELDVNGWGLQSEDQARITGETAFQFEAISPASFVLIDVPLR